MLFVQGAHVRRTHGAVELLSALAHAAAHLDRSCKTALSAKIQCRLGCPGFVLRVDLEGLGHRRSIDDFPRIEQILWIECALDLAKRFVESLAEEFLIKMAARQPVAMFAGHG